MTTAADTIQQRRERVLILIPAYNEAGSIRGVLEDLRAHVPEADTVVIDDGSWDETAAVAESMGAIVLRLPCNLGVGGAMRTGYVYAREKGYDVAIQFDGDGQHRASHIAELIEAVRGGQADLVVGSRVLGGLKFRFHFLRFMGSRLLSTLVSAIAGKTIADPTSGFRAAGGRAISFFSRHYPQAWLGDTVESLVELARHGMQIEEIPVKMRQRKHGKSSIGRLWGFIHTMRIILAVLIDCLERKFDDDSI